MSFLPGPSSYIGCFVVLCLFGLFFSCVHTTYKDWFVYCLIFVWQGLNILSIARVTS